MQTAFIYLLIFKYLFILLAALGLSCGTWDLPCGMRTLSCGMWDLVPRPGIKPPARALGAQSLPTRPPGKSLQTAFKILLLFLK